ncbi:MAG: XTP/dITP diphosphatase [Deltaproteobacteria bacterium]|nr:XTP/dITP diphosphatase [Deltaproteobacteria bacterium]
MKIVIATKNNGKLSEIEKILGSAGAELLTLNEFPDINLPEETGQTFLENAVAKAVYAARKTGMSALADDSGLEVEYLRGRPGVRSARYAGVGATDEENYRKLLKEMAGAPHDQRRGRFVCVIALAEPTGEVHAFEGSLEGFITEAPRGADGFGYDPVFFIPEKNRTCAEINPDEKNSISHRGRALRKLKTWMEERLP